MKKALALLFVILSVVSFAETKVLYNKKITKNNPKMKIMTYNIAAGANNFKVDLKVTAETIKKVNPDIITIQEVDRNTNRSGKIDQAQILADLTGYNMVFGKTIDHDGGDYGIAILSKHPILSQQSLILPSFPNGDTTSPGYEQRIALVTQIEVSGFEVPITFINTHLDWHEDPAVRLQQIRTINEITLDMRGIKILAGDFNDTVNSVIGKEMERYWVSVFDDKIDHRTWPAVNPEVAIDQIYLNKAQVWEAKTYVPNKENEKDGIQWNKVSDHIPVIVDLKLLEQ